MNQSKITYPTEARILEDAMKAFPKHPFSNDVNKKYRDAYIRGQVELISYLKKQNKPASLDKIKIIPPDEHILMQAALQTQADLQREHIDLIILDKSITINQKIEQLEAELEIIPDVDLFTETITRIEKLEDTLVFRSNMKHVRKKLVKANY